MLLGATLTAALVPDLDLLIGPFTGRTYHHYFTHSLGFTGLFAVVVYGVARTMGRASPSRDTLLLTLAYLSHIVLDLLGKDTTPPFGVQLFWPFSDQFFISPVVVFSDVWRGSLSRTFGLHNWLALGREAVLLVPVVGLSWWLRRRRAQLE